MLGFYLPCENRDVADVPGGTSVLTLHNMRINPQIDKLEKGDVGSAEHRGNKISTMLVLLTS